MKFALSIILTNYNYEKYIAMALKSIINQTVKPYEVLIIDDCSTDDSVNIIKKTIHGNSFFILNQNSSNMGVIATSNLGINMARGNYLYFMSSDDYIRPNFVEKFSEFIAKYPNLAICASIPGIFKNENISKHFFYPLHDKSIIVSKDEAKKIFIRTDLRLPGHASIVKRSIMAREGGFLSDLKPFSDWYIYTKIALKFGFGYMHEPLCLWRDHSNSFFQQNFFSSGKISVSFRNYLKIIYDERREVGGLFVKTAVSYQLGYVFLRFLIFKPQYWFVLPYLFIRKVYSIYRKSKKLYSHILHLQ